MFAPDDKAGNVLTTIAMFLAAVAAGYLARSVLLVLFIALLLSYLLDPAVTWLEGHQLVKRGTRTWAIAEVYVLGTVLIGGLFYRFGAHVAAEFGRFHADIFAILQGLSSGRMPPAPSSLALSLAQQDQINVWIAGHHAQIVQLFERGAASVAALFGTALWLFIVPILAIFILHDGRGIVQGMSSGAEHSPALRILLRVHAMLARYVRSQLVLAALSFCFYALALLLLHFPYAFELAMVGGALEMLPALGWVVTAATIVLTGFLMHAHWVWALCLLLLWRLVQDYINSPRIMGVNLGLQPLIVIIAIMVGGEAGGITGAYLGVPTVAALRIAWSELRDPTTKYDNHTDDRERGESHDHAQYLRVS